MMEERLTVKRAMATGRIHIKILSQRDFRNAGRHQNCPELREDEVYTKE